MEYRVSIQVSTKWGKVMDTKEIQVNKEVIASSYADAVKQAATEFDQLEKLPTQD